MPNLPNSLDEVDFYYSLDGAGWSTCFLLVNGSLFAFQLTHIFDNPLESLLGSLQQLMAGIQQASFTWHDEPGEYQWIISRDRGQHHLIDVSVSNCFRLESNSGVEPETVCFKVKLKHFATCVLYQMEKLQALLSDKSYQIGRENQFPYQTFREFRRTFKQEYEQSLA